NRIGSAQNRAIIGTAWRALDHDGIGRFDYTVAGGQRMPQIELPLEISTSETSTFETRTMGLEKKDPKTPKTLVLIDGHSLAYRMHFALERTNMRTADGTPTWAVYGFFNALFSMLKKVEPDAIAVS